MHPEHAPSPEHPPQAQGTEPPRCAPAPTSPEEREALHTLADLKSPPVDRSMLDALGIDAEPADATGDAPVPPAKARGKPKKRRRKRRRPIDCRTWIPDPPIPLDTVARGLWDHHFFGRITFNLLTDRWMLARYCSYLSLWLSTRQVLDTKGLVYMRHRKTKGSGPAPVEAIVALPHTDYLLRLEYVLLQHERALNIDRHDVLTMESRQHIPGDTGQAPAL